MRKRVKIPGIILIILIVLAVLIRLVLPVAAVKIANRQLPGILNTEASIGSVSLGLLRGYVSIRDIRIAQPHGFGDGNLLLAPEVSVKVDLYSLLSPPLTVEEVSLTDWEVNIVKNAEGVMNIDAIQPESSPDHLPPAEQDVRGEPADGKKKGEEVDGEVGEGVKKNVEVEDEISEETKKEKIADKKDTKEEEEEESPSKPIQVRKFSITNLSCSYTDHAIALEKPEAGEELVDGEYSDQTDGSRLESAAAVPLAGESAPGVAEFNDFTDLPEGEEEVLRIQITSLNLLLTDLLVDPAAEPDSVAPASALITARIRQEPFTDGLLGIAARIGPVGGEMPAVNAVLRLADLELEPI